MTNVKVAHSVGKPQRSLVDGGFPAAFVVDMLEESLGDAILSLDVCMLMGGIVRPSAVLP